MNKDLKVLMERYSTLQSKTKPSQTTQLDEVTFRQPIRRMPKIDRHEMFNDGAAGLKTNLSTIQTKMFTVNLENAYATKQPLLVFGPPGTAKSATIIDFSRKMASRRSTADGQGRRIFKYWNKCQEKEQQEILNNPGKYFVLIDVRTVRYDPTDITGVPVPVPDAVDRTLVTMKYSWIVLLCKQDMDGVLFFDEINQGSKPMMNLLMSITLDRDFDGVPMSPNVGIVAAGNLEGGYSNELPPALMNRFSAGVLTIDPDAWLSWAEGNDNSEEDSEESEDGDLLDYSKSSKNQRVDAWITNFVKADKKRYIMQKPVVEGNTPFPSWRAFQKLSDKMHYIEHKHEQYYKQHIIPEVSMLEEIASEAALLCGVDWAHDFMLYIGYTSNFNIKEVIETPKEFIKNHLSEKKLKGSSEVDVVQKGRVYSFITWLAGHCKEAFDNIIQDPTYRQVVINSATQQTTEAPYNYIPRSKDEKVATVKSKEIDSTTLTKNTEVYIAFAKAFIDVLESNDDRAVFKDGLVKMLGGVVPWAQFLMGVATVSKNTNSLDLNEFKAVVGEIKNATTRKTLSPKITSTVEDSDTKPTTSTNFTTTKSSTIPNTTSFATFAKTSQQQDETEVEVAKDEKNSKQTEFKF